MPELNKKSQAVESELRSLETAAVDQVRYMQLAESLDGFRRKLRARAKTIDVYERQQILRLLVKEILVDANSLTIRHSLPIPQISSGHNNAQPPNSTPSGSSQKTSYLLRPGSNFSSARQLCVGWAGASPEGKVPSSNSFEVCGKSTSLGEFHPLCRRLRHLPVNRKNYWKVHRQVELGTMAAPLGAFAARLATRLVAFDERAAKDASEGRQLA
jgi:hypothetical protein